MRLLLLATLALPLLASEGTLTHAWAAPAALNTNANSDSGNDASPQMATDGTGNWVAVWLSLDDLGGSNDRL